MDTAKRLRFVFAASEAAITLFWQGERAQTGPGLGCALKTRTMTNLVLGLGLGLGLPARVWLGLHDDPAHRPRRLMVKPARKEPRVPSSSILGGRALASRSEFRVYHRRL